MPHSGMITRPVEVRDEEYEKLDESLTLYEDKTCKITKAGITLKVRPMSACVCRTVHTCEFVQGMVASLSGMAPDLARLPPPSRNSTCPCKATSLCPCPTFCKCMCTASSGCPAAGACPTQAPGGTGTLVG